MITSEINRNKAYLKAGDGRGRGGAFQPVLYSLRFPSHFLFFFLIAFHCSSALCCSEVITENFHLYEFGSRYFEDMPDDVTDWRVLDEVLKESMEGHDFETK